MAQFINSIANSIFFQSCSILSVLIVIVGLLFSLYQWFCGIFPLVRRLGNALSKRKIAIFAESDNFNSLKTIVEGSGIFNKIKTKQISKGVIDEAENYDLFILYWKDFKDKIDDVLQQKKRSDTLIIYAPVEDGKIDPNDMAKINRNRNTTVVNFPGRLLSDIVTSMITTSYKK